MTYLKYILSTRLTSFDINLGVNLPGLGSVCHVSSLKLLLRLHTVFFGKKSMCSPHSPTGDCSTSLKAEYQNYLEFYGMEDLSTLSLYSVILYSVFYLTLYMLLGCFILWVTIQYQFICLPKVFQLWPLEVFSVGSSVPFTYFHHLWVMFSLQHLLQLWYKMFKAGLMGFLTRS